MALERPDLSNPEPLARPDLSDPDVMVIADGGGVGGLNHELTVVPVTRSLVNGASMEQTIEDVVYSVIEEDDSVTDYQIDLGISLVDLIYPIAWSSSDPAIATVDSDGYVTHVSEGDVIIEATSEKQEFHISTPVTLAEVNGVETYTFNRFVPGSLRARLADQVDTRIAGLDATVAKHLYTSFPSNSNYTDASETRGGVDEFIRNPDFWASDTTNLTCISPSCSYANNTSLHRRSPSGTLISPIHYMTADHWPVPVDSILHFITLDGVLHSRTIIGHAQAYGDLKVGILDSALPSEIIPAKVFPSNVYDSLFSDNLEFVPGLLLDQQEHGMIHELSRSLTLASFRYPKEDSPRYDYVDQVSDNRVKPVVGLELYDSGNPAFVLLDDSLILLTVWTGGGAGSGSSVTQNLSAIQSVMDSLSSTHSKTQYNLTTTTL